MRIKAEYINPSDKLKVILLEDSISIINFSKLIEGEFSVDANKSTGSFDGLTICYNIGDNQVCIDDVFDGGLRILVNANEDFYKVFVEWINKTDEIKI